VRIAGTRAPAAQVGSGLYLVGVAGLHALGLEEEQGDAPSEEQNYQSHEGCASRRTLRFTQARCTAQQAVCVHRRYPL
jgi:hypothetical protein